MGKRTKTEQAILKNGSNYMFYFNRLKELALSMFEWKNLPDTCDERFLELALFENGQAVFFEDEVMGYLALRTTISGPFSVYNVPTKRRAYAVNGYHKNLTNEDSVLIYNNYLRLNTVDIVRLYAQRLWDLDQIIDVNARAQKTPVLLHCSENERVTLLNAYEQFDGNEPVIYADKNLDLKNFTVFKTDAPYIADKIYQLKTQIWNEALTYFGISNLNIQKKERLVADEVVRNQGGTIASRYSRLNARRMAAEQINNMFGLDIEVNYRQDYREADDEVMFSGLTGDGSNADMAIDIRTK